MLGPFLGTLLPRLISGIVRYMQPLLISRAIDYVSRPHFEAEDWNTGYGLILAAMFIYVTMAVTNNMYKQRLNRLDTMIKGSMVGLIHNKALTIQDGIFDDSAAVTLMSSDATSLENIFHMITMLWSSVLEIIIGFYMLGRKLGWACVVPALLVLGKGTYTPTLIFIFDAHFFAVSSRLSTRVTATIVPKIRKYKMSQQKRVGMTASMLGSMKSIKMMGWADTMTSVITKARVQEIDDFKAYRVLLVAYNAVGIHNDPRDGGKMY